MRSPRALLGRIADVRDGEFVRLCLMGAYLLLIITCYTTTKAVRDSVFVIEIGPSQLPYLYILSACAMALISAAYSKTVNRVGLVSMVRLTSFLAIGQLLLFWWLAAYQSRVWLYVLYVWVSLFGAITASQAWLLATQVFDAREARRLFPWIGTGGILGGICGGLLTRIVAPKSGTESLLIVCAGLMFVTTILLKHIAHRSPAHPRDSGIEASRSGADQSAGILAEVRQSRHLSLVMALLVCGVIVEAFVDYEFKYISRQAFSSKDSLTAFFGTLASYGGLLALFVQLAITSRFIKRFGVASAILVLPSAFLVAFVMVALRPALWTASILRLIDGGLSYSVHRSAMELLYVPVPPKQRNKVKAFIDTFVDRMGRATGGLLLLFLTVVLSLTIPFLSFVAVGFLVAWIVLSIAVRREYLNAFRTAVEKKTIEPEALDIRSVDSATIKTLVATLTSPDERRVLYALDLLGNTSPSRWRSQLPVLIDHHSARVRARTLAALAEWKDRTASFLIGRKLEDPDLPVRVEAVRYLCATAPEASAKLREFLHHSDYRIVHSALHYMSQYHNGDRDLIDERLVVSAANAAGEHGDIARAAVACALRLRWTNSDASRRVLDLLLQDSSTEVVRQAIRTCGEVQYAGAIDRLIDSLGQARFRKDAREALLKFGQPVISELIQRLEDADTPMEIRLRIPKALSFTQRQDIADVLVGKVYKLDSRLDHPILKALNRMRMSSPAIKFQTEIVEDLIRRERARYADLSRMMEALKSQGSASAASRAGDAESVLEIMIKAIGERKDEAVDRVFRLLAFVYPSRDVYSAYFTFTAKPALRASAIEFIDNLIDPRFKDLVIPLIESYENEESEFRESVAEMSWEDALHAMLAGDDYWLRAIAEDLISRFRLPESTVLRSAWQG